MKPEKPIKRDKVMFCVKLNKNSTKRQFTKRKGENWPPNMVEKLIDMLGSLENDLI